VSLDEGGSVPLDEGGSVPLDEGGSVPLSSRYELSLTIHQTPEEVWRSVE
jgi:hypothetical protein